MYPLLDASPTGIAHEHLAHHGLGHPAALLGAEQWDTEWGRETFSAGSDPLLDERRSSGIDADGSPTIALPVEYRYGPDVEVDVLGFEGERFTHAES